MSELSVSSGKRELVGRVVSAKMDKTVVVDVNRRKTYKAHDENNEYSLNDRVVIRESRPLSRTKRWVVTGAAEV